jgi:hypothetical protein
MSEKQKKFIVVLIAYMAVAGLVAHLILLNEIINLIKF